MRPVVAEYSVVWVDRGNVDRPCWSMHRILYRLITALARFAVRSGSSKDLDRGPEIIALRHQLGVLRRQTDRPVHTNDDQ